MQACCNCFTADSEVKPPDPRSWERAQKSGAPAEHTPDLSSAMALAAGDSLVGRHSSRRVNEHRIKHSLMLVEVDLLRVLTNQVSNF